MLINLDQKRLSSLSFRGVHARLEADRQYRPDMQMEGMLSRAKTPGERFDGFKENRNGALAVIPNTVMISEATTVLHEAPPFESSRASGVIRGGTRGEPLNEVDEYSQSLSLCRYPASGLRLTLTRLLRQLTSHAKEGTLGPLLSLLSGSASPPFDSKERTESFRVRSGPHV
jgi:hypothetical protein